MKKKLEEVYEYAVIKKVVSDSIDAAITNKVIPAVLDSQLEQKALYNGKIDAANCAITEVREAQRIDHETLAEHIKKFDSYVNDDVRHNTEDRELMGKLKESVDTLLIFQTKVKPLVKFRENLQGFNVISSGTMSFVLKVATVAGAIIFIKTLF